jgi:cytochrome P450
MLNHFGSSMDQMINHLRQRITTNPIVDMKPVFQFMALDVISKCAFGLESNTFEKPNNELYTKAQEIGADFQMDSWIKTIMFHLTSVIPGLQKKGYQH